MLFEATRSAIETSLADSIVQVFVAGFIVSLVSLALSFVIPDRMPPDIGGRGGPRGPGRIQL